MKYIRTRTLIFELYAKEKRLYGDYISTRGIHYRYDCAIKEADTIEELCDCFVYWANESNKPLISICNELAYLPYGYTIKDIYGAIWTDKGLIYVAKMNEDGELELL